MDQVSVDRRGAVAIVTITNPPRGYMNNANSLELLESLGSLRSDTGIRAIVLTGGVPGVFIRHYDVGEIIAAGRIARDQPPSGDGPAAVHQVIDLIDEMPTPVIAAINGFCQGGGFETALACDIRIAEEGDYRIGLPETNLGIFPGAGGTQRLPRVVGMARALELIVRGRTVGPTEAHELGLVHECVDAGNALNRAVEIAEEIAAKPALAVGMAKRLVKNALNRPVSEGELEERAMFNQILLTDDDAMKAMTWFLAHGEDINAGRG